MGGSHTTRVNSRDALGAMMYQRNATTVLTEPEGLIEWHDLRKGQHHTGATLPINSDPGETKCHPSNAALDPQKPVLGAEKEKKPASSNSATIGSDTKPGANSSSVIGMTKRLEERAAAQLDCET